MDRILFRIMFCCVLLSIWAKFYTAGEKSCCCLSCCSFQAQHVQSLDCGSTKNAFEIVLEDCVAGDQSFPTKHSECESAKLAMSYDQRQWGIITLTWLGPKPFFPGFLESYDRYERGAKAVFSDCYFQYVCKLLAFKSRYERCNYFSFFLGFSLSFFFLVLSFEISEIEKCNFFLKCP